MTGIIDHKSVKQQKGLKESKQAQRGPKKEIVNLWAL